MTGETQEFEVPGEPRWWRVVLLLAGCAAVAVFIAVVTTAYAAYRFSLQPDETHLERAVRLNPFDAEYRARLGRWQFFIRYDPVKASRAFEDATRLNPYGAAYWLLLATARLRLGDSAGEFRALENAVAVAPTTPAIAWETGVHFAVNGHDGEALQVFHNLLESAPDEYNRVFTLCWRALHDRERILRNVAPRNPAAYLSFQRVLLEFQAYDDAAAVWKAALAFGRPLPTRDALYYVDDLLRRHQPEAAASAWSNLLDVNPSLGRYRQNDNLVTNSSFEEPLLNDAFDWRFPPVGGPVDFSLDSGEIRTSPHTLLLTFGGDPVGDTGLFQFVAVKPSTDYSFRAIVKAAELASASPMRFQFWDADTSALLGSSKDVSGTTGDWVRVDATVRTGATSRLLRIGIAHAETSHVKGRLWVESVELKPVTENAIGR